MKKIFLALFIFSFSVEAHEFDDFRWLVKVRSTFKDSVNESQSYVEVGYGFVVETFGKYLVLTAKHLSLGGVENGQPNLRIDYYDPNSKTFLPLKILARHVVAESDIEVVEIEKTKDVEPLAALGDYYKYEGQDGDKLYLLEKWQKHFSKSFDTGVAEGFTALGFRSFIPKSEVLSKNIVSPIESLSGKAELREAVLTNQNYVNFGYGSIAEYGFIEHKHEIVTYAKGFPGMSGLPLIYKPYEYLPNTKHREDWTIHGIYSAGSETFQKSWYAKIDGALNVIDQNVNPKPSFPNRKIPLNTPTVHIRAHKGAVYRVGKIPVLARDKVIPGQTITTHIANELYFQEALLVGKNSEAPVLQRKAHGNGSRADGGNGTRADGGISEAPSPTKSFLEAGMLIKLGDYKNEGFLDKAWNWAFGKKEETFELEETPTVAFETGAYIYAANTTNLLWLIEKIRDPVSYDDFKPDHFNKISIHSNKISEKIWESWTRDFLSFGHYYYRPQKEENGTWTMYFTGRDLKSANPFLKQVAKVNVEFVPSERNIYFKIFLPNDAIEFGLGPTGALLPNETRYKSEILVKGSKTGSTYRLDLDSFAFQSKDGDTGRSGPYNQEWDRNLRTLSLLGPDSEFLMTGEYSFFRDR
jgi:hypothetical protein